MQKMFFTFIFIFIFSFIDLAYAELKIGYVDIEEILSESKTVGKIRRKLKKEMDESTKILQEKAQNFKKIQEKFVSQMNVLSEEAKFNERERIYAMKKDLNRQRNNEQDKFERRGAHVMNGVILKIRKIAVKIGKSEGFDLILNTGESTAVLYASEKIDITNDVIKLLDAK